MKRSKTQAVYRFLPEMWISEKDDSERAVSAKIKNWNYIKMSDIYEDFIEGEIKRQVKLFGDRGGDISAFDLSPDTHSFAIVETACNEGIPDIIGEISPLVFYCSSCGAVSDLRNPDAVDKYTWKCKNPDCGKWAVKQLQMIYACECGYAQPIKIPHVQGVKNFKFRPNETQYKMFYRSGNSEKPAEFVQICPNCNSRLVPDNANSGRNYKPFTLKVINLVDQRNGQFYKKGIDAQKTIVCRWFDKLSTADYDEILNNIELAFSDAFKSDAQRRNVKQQVRALIDAGMLPPEMFESAVNNMLQNAPNTKSVERYVAMCDDLFSRKKAENPVGYAEWLSHFSFKLMQYDTLKYAKRIITLEEAIQRQLDMDFIDSPEEVTALNKKMGITNMQVSCDIQIINCTYGYSRRVADPKNSTNKNCRLKLNAYDRTRDGTANLVYGVKLDTEGILFEISQRKIVEWLYENNIISEEQLPDLDDDVSVKKWFAQYVHSDVISMFGEIDDSEKITKNVFALLHSMSHAFMNAAGELSGLSSNSLTEIILVETASIFIYAQTSQGIPLGALSGMAESNYAFFLKKAFDEAKNCVFDPICTERDDTACSACLIIPEISCNHFNAELGRKYLYSIDGVDNPTVGFWEM
ncbi:Zn-binding domain-containing protein [Faecalibacterium prausnitzii]|jgi:hypothetical protein|uniref:Zn-binding domain-containing protein n=1 Tax=Faecalibacterium prausnitzii TaxID=853 RepID=UPI001CBF782F|nr:Zn-binding domain-containing protein [Faecalibacterium prausnitzii]